MTEQEKLLEPQRPERVAEAFQLRKRLLGVTDEELQPGKSICVIGAGNNVFAAGMKASMGEQHAFVMGVDPARDKYKILDPAIINHDARALGLPSEFEGFDTVVSFHAVPKYFFMWLARPEARASVINEGRSRYDYGIAEEPHTTREAIDAVQKSLSEMLRITKPGGRILLYPVPIPARKGVGGSYKSSLDILKMGLWLQYPGLTFTYTDLEKGETIPGANGNGPAQSSDFIYSTLEIRRPAKKKGKGS